MGSARRDCKRSMTELVSITFVSRIVILFYLVFNEFFENRCLVSQSELICFDCVLILMKSHNFDCSPSSTSSVDNGPFNRPGIATGLLDTRSTNTCVEVINAATSPTPSSPIHT